MFTKMGKRLWETKGDCHPRLLVARCSVHNVWRSKGVDSHWPLGKVVGERGLPRKRKQPGCGEAEGGEKGKPAPDFFLLMLFHLLIVPETPTPIRRQRERKLTGKVCVTKQDSEGGCDLNLKEQMEDTGQSRSSDSMKMAGLKRFNCCPSVHLGRKFSGKIWETYCLVFLPMIILYGEYLKQLQFHNKGHLRMCFAF